MIDNFKFAGELLEFQKIKQKAIDEFGSLNQWHEHYIKAISSDNMQKRYRKKWVDAENSLELW